MSAGLSRPAQCIQQSGYSSFLISETLFCTNGFQVFSTPLIQKSDTVESVKQRGVNKGISSSIALVIEDNNLARSTAACNSNLGIV